MHELERVPRELITGIDTIRELFGTLLFQPDSVYPITLSHRYSLILMQTEDVDGNQIRCIVSEDFECAPHNYSGDPGYSHDDSEDPVGLMTDGTRTIIDIDTLDVRTTKFEAFKDEIQGYFYACEQMIDGGILLPESYLGYMTYSLKEAMKFYPSIPLAQHPGGIKIWEEVLSKKRN